MAKKGMAPNPEEIIKVIKDCIRQDRNAQKKLYQMHYSYCMNICMRYAPSREDAVEMMNDGFMNVFSYLHKFDLKRPFIPWLKKIMINSSIDHLKSNNKIEASVSLDYAQKDTENDYAFDSLSYEDLLIIIRKLSPSYAAVFNLRAIEGYKHEEVAEILGISVGTSKSNYAKAKRKLQEYLAAYFEVKN